MPSKELNFAWEQLQGSEKEFLRAQSLDSNANSAAGLEKNQVSVLKCAVTGPFGSDDVEVPFDANRVSCLLNTDNCKLRSQWKRSNITKRMHSLEAKNDVYKPSVQV